jgi:hypothetical protein
MAHSRALPRLGAALGSDGFLEVLRWHDYFKQLSRWHHVLLLYVGVTLVMPYVLVAHQDKTAVRGGPLTCLIFD